MFVPLVIVMLFIALADDELAPRMAELAIALAFLSAAAALWPYLGV